MTPRITDALAEHIASARGRGLDERHLERTKLLLLDSIVAIVSGATLKPGIRAVDFALSRPGRPASTVAGSGQRTAPELAALANGMCAHADETDDTNELVPGHHGAAIIPAALAAAEDAHASGRDLLVAISLGYHVNSAIALAAWRGELTNQHPRGLALPFGALAAAASLYGLRKEQVAQALTYGIQQVGGVTSFFRDSEHVEKAFISGGQQASSGLASVNMVRSGMTAVEDGFDKEPNFFSAISQSGDGMGLMDLLGQDEGFVFAQNLKWFPVGMPLQAPMRAATQLLAANPIDPREIEEVVCHLPSQKLEVVNNRQMPDIDARYCLATIFLTGKMHFRDAHDYDRFSDPDVRAMMERVSLRPDASLDAVPGQPRNTRRAIITVLLRDGRRLEERVDVLRGTWLDPFSWQEVESKAHAVLDDIVGVERTAQIVAAVDLMASAENVSVLAELLAVPVAAS